MTMSPRTLSTLLKQYNVFCFNFGLPEARRPAPSSG